MTVPATAPTGALTPSDVDGAAWARLRSLAVEAMGRAYAPYSRFRVGAAGLVDDGRMVSGCNVENAGYGVTLCAECGLVSELVRTGGGRLIAFACVDGRGEPCAPCGRCRQVLGEHAHPRMLLAMPGGLMTIDQVLPGRFTRADLEGSGAGGGGRADPAAGAQGTGARADAVEPFDDIHVRKAVAHAVDRTAIVSSILKGQGTVATGIEPPEQLGSEIGEQAAADAQAGLPIDSFDLDAARAELAQSKVPGGFDAELTYPSSIPDLGSAALSIADNLKKIGINVEIVPHEKANYLKPGDFEMSLYSVVTMPTGDPYAFLRDTMSEKGAANFSRYHSPAVQGMLAELPNTFDFDKRVALVNRIQQQAIDDGAMDFIGFNNMQVGISKKVTGFLSTPSDYYHVTKDLDKK
mgnify:CR=1 FL=1